jgi:hypothetical protein
MAEVPVQMDRRRFLQAVAAAAASAGLSGCHHGEYSVLAAGTFAPDWKGPVVGPLTIDTHCHLFNGTDIQLERFLLFTHQDLSQRMVDLAQKLEEKIGPRGEVELAELVVLARLSKCAEVGRAAPCPANRRIEPEAAPLSPPGTQPESARKHINQMRDREFNAAKKGIATSMAEHPPKSRNETTTDERLLKMLDAEDHPTFRTKLEKATGDDAGAPAGPVVPAAPVEKPCGDGSNLGGELETVVDYFLPRIALAQIYLDTFCPPAGRNVDLLFSVMVDYDWWLAKGESPVTPLKMQVKLTEQISILSGGRIHGFAPFCPLREVAHRAGHGGEKRGWSSLEFVKDAVLKHGCIGVKLYPPMGFAAYGNAELDVPEAPPWDASEIAACDADPARLPLPHPDFWARNPLLPEWVRDGKTIAYADDASDERLGVRLDQALDALYTWCQEAEVPILAHTNTTNGVDCVYERLAVAAYWEKALAKYPRLRVNFGHLGGFDDELDRKKVAVPASSQQFIGMMGDGGQAAAGTHTAGGQTVGAPTTFAGAYADSAFDAVLLSCHEQFVERFDMAYNSSALPDRFMYGTDWSLMVHVGHNRRYLKDYEKLMEMEDANHAGPGRKPSEKFFGWNAVEYAGLEKTGQARQRLQAFYARYCLQQPEWALKVDA